MTDRVKISGLKYMDLEVIGLKGETISSSIDQDAKVEEAKEEAKVETKAEAEGTTEVESKESEQSEESIEALPGWAQNRLKKAEEERENLSKAVSRLNKEKKSLTIEQPEKEVEKEIEYPDWDETSKKFQEQTLSKAEKLAEKKVQERIEMANEKAAIDKFIKNNSDVDWNDIVSNYQPKYGRDTVEDIMKDLERAKILARFERGELANLESEALKKGERKGKAEANIADLVAVSKTTSKTGKEESTLSAGALRMAERMRVDPKKLAQEDDSLTATIKF